jgi:hypothetical protein
MRMNENTQKIIDFKTLFEPKHGLFTENSRGSKVHNTSTANMGM